MTTIDFIRLTTYLRTYTEETDRFRYKIFHPDYFLDNNLCFNKCLS